MRIFISVWLLLGLMGGVNSVCAQSFVRIAGRVLDAETRLPLAYAYVHIDALGSLTNDQGEFALRIPQEAMADTLEVTFLGYRPTRILWRSMPPELGDVLLKPAPLTLEEVEIRPMEPRDTLRKVWKQRRYVYAAHPIQLSGYYREYMREPGTPNEYFFGEGVLEIYKPGFPIRGRLDQVRIVKSRSKPRKGYIEKDTSRYVLPMVTQGPHLGTELDLLRITDSFLKPGNLRAYDLGLGRITKLNGRITYVFNFRPHDDENVHAQFLGQLFIDANTLALVRASYQLTPYGLSLVSQSQDEVDLIQRFYIVNYRKTDRYWVIQDAQVENVYKHRELERELRALMTFVVTDIAERDIKAFPPGQQMRLNEAFAAVAETVTPDFWADFNIIVPEDSILSDQ